MSPAPKAKARRLRKPASRPLVGVVMGSQSDWEVMREACTILSEFGVPYEAKVVSAHRTPDAMFGYAARARARGLRVVIAGAGGAAHLPGMIASKTTLPVLGVPVPSRHLAGQDSLLSIVQMPKGIPVATFAIGQSGAANAGLFAVALLATGNRPLAARLERYRAKLRRMVAKMRLSGAP
jgi:5-(carboxyamino)imidazole ribonucleotide mutase